MSRLCLPVHMNDFSTRLDAIDYATKLRDETGWVPEIREVKEHWEVWA